MQLDPINLAVLTSRTFCNDRNVLYLHCPIWYPLAPCGYWAPDMRNGVFPICHLHSLPCLCTCSSHLRSNGCLKTESTPNPLIPAPLYFLSQRTKQLLHQVSEPGSILLLPVNWLSCAKLYRLFLPKSCFILLSN